MAISSQRFSMLDNETNVGTANFGLGADASIMNTPINALKPKLTKLSALINSSFSTDALSFSEADEDVFTKAARLTKDGLSNIVDFSAIPTESLTAMFGSLTDSTQLIKSVLGMLSKCVGGAGGYGFGSGRGMNRNSGCGGGGYGSKNSGCSITGFGDLLSKLTNGNFNSGKQDYDSQLRALMAMSGMGYDQGYCNVFGSLSGSGNFGKDILNKVAGGLLGYLGRSGNTNGFMDVVKSSVSLSPMLANPSAISGFFDNFKTPLNTKQNSFVNLADGVLESSESLKFNWNKTSGNTGAQSNGIQFEDGPSLGFVTTYRKDLGSIFSSKLSNREFTTDSLDAVPDSDEDFFLGAYSMST